MKSMGRKSCIAAALLVAWATGAAATTVTTTSPISITLATQGMSGSATYSFSPIANADGLLSISGGTLGSNGGEMLKILIDYTDGSNTQIYSQNCQFAGCSFNLSTMASVAFPVGTIDGLTFQFSTDALPYPTDGGSLSIPSGTVFSFDVAPSVPEPTTWAMMLLGFGAVGGAMRYGRRNGSLNQAVT